MIELLDSPGTLEEAIKTGLLEKVTELMLEKKKTTGKSRKVVDGKWVTKKNRTDKQKQKIAIANSPGKSIASAERKAKITGKKIKKNFKKHGAQVLKKRKRSERKRGNK